MTPDLKSMSQPATGLIKAGSGTVEPGDYNALVDYVASIQVPQQAANVADPAITATDPPTAAEVQALADTLSALLTSLKDAGVMAAG
jgi:hypothetical protein